MTGRHWEFECMGKGEEVMPVAIVSKEVGEISRTMAALVDGDGFMQEVKGRAHRGVSPICCSRANGTPLQLFAGCGIEDDESWR